MGVRKHYLRHRTAWGEEALSEAQDGLRLRGPQACKEAGPSGFQALGHPGTTGSLARAEDRVGAWGWI